MFFVPKKYRHETKQEAEYTTRIVVFYNFEDIQQMVEKYECTSVLYLANKEYSEEIVSNICGYKVELVDEKLEKVNDKDLWCLAKLLAWTFEARKGKKISVQSAFEFLEEKNILDNYMQMKSEFRVVVPHKYEHIEANIRSLVEKKPISMKSCIKGKYIVPTLVNAGAYGKIIDVNTVDEEESHSIIMKTRVLDMLKEDELNRKR
ncbi:hypothetical protein SAMN05421493_11835 [Pseudobutyrivibrio sp. 49]|uniref:hypothetical protein n=1 Tax=Pseudobutyrivibrio sp. 49 TaxID=1855344 RepID=UPI00088FAC17|nr:hypothetical protein [Pseudobutyrivibrio sp. 49]SDI56789.1 hypothetical protein SAMN05421493_11835 [Pseudobutyrivibrio sp. 49]